MTLFSSVHDDVAKYTQSVNKRKLNNIYLQTCSCIHVHTVAVSNRDREREGGGGVETLFKEVNFPTISIRIRI